MFPYILRHWQLTLIYIISVPAILYRKEYCIQIQMAIICCGFRKSSIFRIVGAFAHILAL